MGLFDYFKSKSLAPKAQSSAGTFRGFDDPAFLEFIRSGAGAETESGVTVTVEKALKNTTLMRCVSLISFCIGNLPLHLRERDTKHKAEQHPLYSLLQKPNNWQTRFQFRSLMQYRALVYGDAYARIIWSGQKPIALIPISNERIKPKQLDNFDVLYEYTSPNGRQITLNWKDVFHISYGISHDGLTGVSLVKEAAEAIGLAIQTEKAAARLFTKGMLAGGALEATGALSDEAFNRLKKSMEKHEGADNAHQWLILEEGLKANTFNQTGRDSQHIETRKHQIEEIARPFGVPRPLLGVDDTSWGSGIDVLGQFFVRYGLNPWFVAWEQAIERDLLSDREATQYEAKYNANALLRGSMKEQAEYWALALGAGGHHPWLLQEEVRELDDRPRAADLGKGFAHKEATNVTTEST
ncbi:phage portal protein [Flexibacterium corallicola]|uniref:phage portal protein n=1 Tax=Flexibacterium corallicola TaxID=3037259 RepID=UPI00286EC06A|nr:phage portal protein [Pseudovibrio sp. M1P-2-3]